MGVCAVIGLLSGWTVTSAQQQAGTSLGSVRLPQRVALGGQALAAGTYTLRATNDPVEAVVGQAPESTQWVEFVQGGQVRGRTLATKLTPEEVKEVSESGIPASGSSRVEMLKGGDYLRIWLNRGGTNYLIHLSVTPQ
jgi:hypothetical protein